eukprot:scaffold2874_cov110-Alexandrium_tamarense.AAC.17
MSNMVVRPMLSASNSFLVSSRGFFCTKNTGVAGGTVLTAPSATAKHRQTKPLLCEMGASDILVGLSQGSRLAELSPVSRFDFTSLSTVLTTGEAETASTSSDSLSA